MTPQYFKLTPITEKPEKEGWYFATYKYMDHQIGDYVLYSELHDWNDPDLTQRESAHWLQPLPADTIVISEEKLREILRQAHSNGLNRSPFIIENVIAELKAIAETSQTSPSQDRAK